MQRFGELLLGFAFHFFETQSKPVSQTALEFTAILLPHPLNCWDYMCETPCLILERFCGLPWVRNLKRGVVEVHVCYCAGLEVSSSESRLWQLLAATPYPR